MNEILFHLRFGGIEVVVTAWKIIGYCGTLLFAGRWVVQFLATRAAGRPVMPRAFWYMSVVGSLMLLSYFTMGKSDSVGVLSNLFPAFTASYNLWLDVKTRHYPAQHPAAKG
ncbi:MAG: lipid-A-disaccharide synthase N-terminal domain-containing protein [Opitutaceae bacterium]|jgi:lipid-A-disaccharide synthase-like uncharacterized protein